jgi:transposase-like protein
VAALALKISEAEERELRRRAAQYTRPHREVLRANIVLLAADGLTNAEIARRLGCTDKTPGRWRRRFAEEGLAGLDEKPRPGRPRSFSPRADRRGQGDRVRASRGVGPAAGAVVFARLDADLARVGAAAPFATAASTDFFSDRIGCQVHQPIYGISLGALCVRR